jgi:hypothetical protein
VIQQGGDMFTPGRPLDGEDAQRPALDFGHGRQSRLLPRGRDIRIGGQPESSARIADNLAVEADADGA